MDGDRGRRIAHVAELQVHRQGAHSQSEAPIDVGGGAFPLTGRQHVHEGQRLARGRIGHTALHDGLGLQTERRQEHQQGEERAHFRDR